MKKLLIGVFLFVTLGVQAQFSELDQFYPFVAPTTFNPANAGNFILRNNAGNYQTARLQSNTSISAINRLPKLTTNLSLDGRVSVFRKDYIGIGGDYEYQRGLNRVSDGQRLGFRISYQKRIGSRRQSTILSLGMGAVIIQSSLIDPNNTTWGYNQRHGLSLTHQPSGGKSTYQLGVSHSMYQYLGGFRDGAVDTFSRSLDWTHLGGLQAYGEWELSDKWSINAVLNYNHWFIELPFRFVQYSVGGTVAVAYGFNVHDQQWKLIAGVGFQLAGLSRYNDLNHLNCNGFLGVERKSFRVLIRLSTHTDYWWGSSHGDTYGLHHIGVSLGYAFIQKRIMGGVPRW